MKKTDRILRYLADYEGGPAPSSDIAAALDDAEGLTRTNALMNYLKGRGLVMSGPPEGREATWRITAAGRTWIGAIDEEAAEDARESARRTAAKAGRERAADPEGLPPPKKNGSVHGLTIERGIPLPNRIQTGKYKDLAAAMKVGDSVLLPVASGACQLRKALLRAGRKGASRQSDGGYRTWRIA